MNRRGNRRDVTAYLANRAWVVSAACWVGQGRKEEREKWAESKADGEEEAYGATTPSGEAHVSGAWATESGVACRSVPSPRVYRGLRAT